MRKNPIFHHRQCFNECNSWLSLNVLQTSLLFYYTREQKKKNASATHLHDLLGIIPDEFEEEKRASCGEQQNEAVSL